MILLNWVDNPDLNPKKIMILIYNWTYEFIGYGINTFITLKVILNL